ncbi:unnamed protein product [Moneuplotes crassus]|uniref:Uncharacterized protein n=1 Tax=Euplotes crassus TaxID=5936 RepID=A0AAD2CZF5_EUPCR|nr:unnamed protein product [Moneuplotes crassus]
MEKRGTSTKKYNLKTNILVKPKAIHRRIESLNIIQQVKHDNIELDVKVPTISFGTIPSLKNSDDGRESHPYELSHTRVKKVYTKDAKNKLAAGKIRTFRKQRRSKHVSPGKIKLEKGMNSSHSHHRTLYSLPYAYETHNRSLSKQNYKDNESYISSQTFYLKERRDNPFKEAMNPTFNKSRDESQKNPGLNLENLSLNHYRDDNNSKSTHTEAKGGFIGSKLNMTQPLPIAAPGKKEEEAPLPMATSHLRRQSQGSIIKVKTGKKDTKRYKKFLADLLKLEEEIDKFDIEYSISINVNKKYKSGTPEYLSSFMKKCKFVNKISKKIEASYKKSEFNSLKIMMTKGKHDEESKLISTIYTICARVIDELITCRNQTESHYLSVIESKDYTINNLSSQLDCANAQLQKIEEDKISLKRDVDVEIKKLEALGNFDDLEKPDFLSVGFFEANREEDPSFTLTDIYQFLLFEGEIVKDNRKQKNVSPDYHILKDILTQKFFDMQKMTAEQVIKRVYKRTVPVEVEVQTGDDPLVKEFEILKDKEMNLFRKKCNLEVKLKNQEMEMAKHRLQVAELEQKYGILNTENTKILNQLKRYKNLESQMEQDKDTITRYQYQIEQFPSEIKKRDSEIQSLLKTLKRMKFDMGQVVTRFQEMMASAKVMEDEIRVKQNLVERLKRNLSSLRSYVGEEYIETPAGGDKEKNGMGLNLDVTGDKQESRRDGKKDQRVQTDISGSVTKESNLTQKQIIPPFDYLTESARTVIEPQKPATKVDIGIDKKIFSNSPSSIPQNICENPNSKQKSPDKIEEKSDSEEFKQKSRTSSRIGIGVRQRETSPDRISKAQITTEVAKEEDTMKDLLQEKEKITKFLLECGYMVETEVQTKKTNSKPTKEPKKKSVGTQRPTEEDKIDELLDGVDARSVAQTQLNLLMETLENLRREGAIQHINLTEEDIEMIKEEMRKLIVEKSSQEAENVYLSAQKAVYTGGSSFKTAGTLNLGMKDPTLQYSSNNDYCHLPPPMPRSKMGGGMTASRLSKKRRNKK